MRAKTLVLVGTVALAATGCAARGRSGTVSLSPGKTVWMSGPGHGSSNRATSSAKPGDRSRTLQDSGRTEQQQARAARVRRGGTSAIDGSTGAAASSAGTTGMSPAAAPPAAPREPAHAAPDPAPAPLMEAGLARHFQATRAMAVVAASTLVIVVAIIAAQRFRRRTSPRGNVRPFGR